MIDVDCFFFLLCPYDDYIPGVNYSAQSTIFKALNTGHIDEHVSCVRKWRTAAETCVSPEHLIEMRGLWQTREKATERVPISRL